MWFHRQKQFPWHVFAKPPPTGPRIKANLSEGCCGVHVLHLTRMPLTRPGKAGWSALLSIFHCDPASACHSSDENAAEKGERNVSIVPSTTDMNGATVMMDGSEWHYLEHQHLVKHQAMASIVILRSTFITLMAITNARKDFQHSDAAGFRSTYGSYSGLWHTTWPVRQEAVVKFVPHDLYSAATDVYPPSFVQMVGVCVQVLAGVVSAPWAGLRVAFCGRKPTGTYTLEYVSMGFPDADGSRHLYDMIGGVVYDVDFLFASQQSSSSDDMMTLELPSANMKGTVRMHVPHREQQIIQQALDCLPWTSMSWSLHRGMRDILVAYAKPTFNRHRQELAALLKQTVTAKPHVLDCRGWNPSFVRHSMAGMAASAFPAGRGNSGDLVRIVADVVLATIGD